MRREKTVEINLINLAVAVILAGILICWIMVINKPFIDNSSYNDAAFSNIGRNYLKLGFLETKFGPIWEVNPKQPPPYFYYLHHPPLTGILVGFAFKIFGVHEWSARLFPILFSLGWLFLIYLITKKLYDEKKAVISLTVAVLMPITFIYGKLISHEPFTLFFCLFMLYAYLKYLDDNQWFRWIIIGLALGLLSGWPIFYMSFLIFIHYTFIVKKQPVNPKSIFFDRFVLLLLMPVLFFCTWLLYSAWLTGSINGVSNLHSGKLAYEGLFERLSNVADFNKLFNTKYLIVLLTSLFNKLLTYITAPVIMLSTYYFANKTKSKDYILPGLLVFGLIHILIFSSGGVTAHDFWVYYFIPCMAITSAITITKIKTRSLLVMISIIFILLSYQTVQEAIKFDKDKDLYDMGQKIGSITKANETIGVIHGYYGPVIEFYANRYFEWDISDTQKHDYLLVDSNQIKLKDNILKKVDFVDIGYGYYLIFKDRIKTIDYKNYINFDDTILFLGNNYKYQNDYIFITYFWNFIKKPSYNYKIFVHFADENGSHLFGQDHFLKDGLVDMRTLNIDDKLAESYILKVPKQFRGKTFQIFIGLFDENSGKRITISNGIISDNRYRIK